MFRFITIIYSRYVKTPINNYLKYISLILVLLAIIISYIGLIQTFTNRYEYTLNTKNDDKSTEVHDEHNKLGELRFSDNPDNFTLSLNKNLVDEGDFFTLSWTPSGGADNYSVYSSSKNITQIDGDSTLIKSNLTRLNYSIIASNLGVLYYVVVAYNKSGNTLSNCVKIQVVEGDGSSDRKSLGGDFLSINFSLISILVIGIIMLLSFSSIMLYKAKRKYNFNLKNNENQSERFQAVKKLKSSTDIVDKTINNTNLINTIEEGKDLSKFELSSISTDFLSKVDKFKWNQENQKEQFIQEMLTLTPEERDDIIKYMGEKSKNDNFTY